MPLLVALFCLHLLFLHPVAIAEAFSVAMSQGGDESGSIPLRAGFIGCGTIASAIASSLASPEHARHLADGAGVSLESISVTRRSEARSSALAAAFPGVVTVCDTPAEVVATSDLVFLCVLPQHVDGVLDEVRNEWDGKRHTLVSLVSTSSVGGLVTATGLDGGRVYKMICLPAIEKREGCALLQPAAGADPDACPGGSVNVRRLLDSLGGCVVCPDDEAMNTMMVTTAMMGPLYGMMRNNREWLVARGISASDAGYFVSRSYLSMVQDAERSCREAKRLDELVAEQTPGGLNEQALGNLAEQGVFGAFDNAMDAVLSRLEGKSDGSLPPSGDK